ncbi:MAG: L,D-transpeptidase [Muribaculaceae bacterium]|nr:L,D-transpeptidase [Muribaculaceae bacterium]
MNSRYIFFNLARLTYLYIAFILPGCSGDKKSSSSSTPDSPADEISVFVEKDSVIEKREPQPGDPDFRFNSDDSVSEYLDTCRNAALYSEGILPVIAKEVPKYAARLLSGTHTRFIVVDKASMRVILYDRYGRVEKSYDMACAKNFGTKHKKADSRTPEGFFEVEGIYNSTDWLYTDDDGVTSKKKGQFGPRFIRLKIPVTSQIGIHGTCSPWSIGHRTSHGCIRITNENIMELVELVEPGMPVIVLPGKRDRAVNREEGYFIPYFPTEQKYAMTEKEKSLPYSDKREEDLKAKTDTIADDKADSGSAQEDSIKTAPDAEDQAMPDSIASGKESI